MTRYGEVYYAAFRRAYLWGYGDADAREYATREVERAEREARS